MVATSESDPSRYVPPRIGRYELLLPIASGGMAKVYLARTRGVGGFERDVALKLTHAHLRDSDEFAHELIEEAKLAVGIRHANVVPVLDVGEDPHGVFLVMEYIEGATLAELMRGRELPDAVGMHVLCDALAGLHAAHELRDERGQHAGLVHRDVSPQNILVGLDGVSRLADFGIAKAATRLGHTRTGMVKGKLAYMAPEQARDLSIDRRVDIWAAGVIAWEILAGRRFFRAKSEAAILLELVAGLPRRLQSVRPDIPAALDEAIARALTVDPNERWSTAEELAHALREGCEGYLPRLDRSAVAEYVRARVGIKVAERRTRAAEILRLRSEADALAGSVSNDSVDPSPSHDAPIDTTDTTSVSQNTPSKRTWFALGPVVLLVLASALWWNARGASATLASLSIPSPAALPAASSAPVEVDAGVSVTANAPLASLQIGSRLITVPEPTTSLQLALDASERKGPMRVVARSADGRTVAATLERGAAALELAFAPQAGSPKPGRRLAKSPYR